MSEQIFLPVHEVFKSIQGEGFYSGRAAFFIRLFGCPVHCPWCDSAGTWHRDYVPETVERCSLFDLTMQAVRSEVTMVILTGGEPTIHKGIEEMPKLFHSFGLKLHIETCGGFEINLEEFNWITLSPKYDKPPLPKIINQAHEFKIIVEKLDDIGYWTSMILAHAGLRKGKQPVNAISRPIWLHPEWSKRNDKEVLKTIMYAVKTRPDIYRAGWQIHKLYSADILDERSKKPAPLGGNPELGF